MTDPTRPTLDHAPRCQRRHAPMLRAAWNGSPEYWCPSCGRHAPADTRQTTVTATATTDSTTMKEK